MRSGEFIVLHTSDGSRGATSVREPMTTFYGDRSAGVKDLCGNVWWIASHIEDVSPEEMARRMKA